MLDFDEYTGVSRKKLRGQNYKPYLAAVNDEIVAWNPCDYQPSCFILAFPLAKVYDSSATVGIGIDTLGTSAHMVLSLDFTAKPEHVGFRQQWNDSNKTKSAGGDIGVSETLAANMVGWDMLVVADTSRVLRFADGVVTASV